MLREEQRRRSKEGTVMVEPVAHGKNPDGTDITDAQMRELIRHPTAGLFRDKGGAAWPMDQFTMRRIRDGDIKMMEDQDQTPKVSPPRRPPRSSSTSQE
jgi:hypothetical protein